MRWPVLLIGVVLVCGVVVFAMSYGSPQSAETSATTTGILLGVPDGEYKNAAFDFSIRHPENVTPQTAGFEGYFRLVQNPIVAIALPGDIFRDTNLVDAGIYIGIATDTKISALCSAPAAGEKPGPTKKLGDTIFNSFTLIGAAAGNIYETTSYRALHNGDCYEIAEVLHSGNIGNYPVGEVTQFDPNDIKPILDKILDTFAFTTTAGSGVEGKVQVKCLTDASDTSCAPQIRTIEAYQGPASVGLFKTRDDGAFRADLPPGQYELRVDTASSTHCASVGIVVQENSYISTNISCDVGE